MVTARLSHYTPDLFTYAARDQGPEHAKALHGKSQAQVFLMGQRSNGNLNIIERLPGYELAAWISAHAKFIRQDFFISQNRFTSNRRATANLSEIGAVYIDLDFYKTKLYQEFSPDRVYCDLCLDLDAAKVPLPSLAIYSGRGLYAVWLLMPGYGLADLYTWKQRQANLCRLLKDYGADPKALDAARVLRLCGSSNSRTRETVRAFDGTGLLHTLNNIPAANLEQPTDTHPGIIPDWVGILHSKRLADLMRLPGLMGGCIPEGIRNAWLWITYNSLATIDGKQWHNREQAALIDHVADGYKRSECRAVIRSIERRYLEMDLYKVKTNTIRELLSIDKRWCIDNKLYALAGNQWLHGRELNIYKRSMRGHSREVYLEEVTKACQRVIVKKLRGEGLSTRAIAAKTCISQTRVLQILSRKVNRGTAL